MDNKQRHPKGYWTLENSIIEAKKYKKLCTAFQLPYMPTIDCYTRVLEQQGFVCRHILNWSDKVGESWKIGLAVLYALLFDFLNYASGRLDPAIDTIAQAANISPRSAARGLANLKAAGVLNWARRCITLQKNIM